MLVLFAAIGVVFFLPAPGRRFLGKTKESVRQFVYFFEALVKPMDK